VRAEEARKNIQAAIEKAGENANPQELDDDSEDDDAPIIKQDADDGAPSDPVDQEQSHVNDAAIAAIEEKETAAIEEEEERKVDRILAFLADPETVVKMFLSSYMRKEGLIWYTSIHHFTVNVKTQTSSTLGQIQTCLMLHVSYSSSSVSCCGINYYQSTRLA